MKFNTYKEILEFALEKEIEAVTFYKSIAENERSSGSSELFKGFADEEDKHCRIIENMMEENIEEVTIKSLPAGESELNRSNYLVDVEYHPQMDFQDSMILAIKREEKAVKLYKDLFALTDQAAHKTSFQFLINEEQGHKQSLEKIYDDYMARMGD